MPTRFERWMRSKLSAITEETPSSAGALAAQSREEPEPYIFPARMMRSEPCSRACRAASNSEATSPVNESKVQPPKRPSASLLRLHVREAAPHHDLMIAAARPVGIEISLIEPVAAKVGRGGRVGRDGARRRDVVGRDEITEECQGPRSLEFETAARTGIVEVRRSTHVRGGRVPGERGRGLDVDGVPIAVALARGFPDGLEHRGIEADARMAETSSSEGIRSASITDPAAPWQTGSVDRSMSIVPANEYATTSEGAHR